MPRTPQPVPSTSNEFQEGARRALENAERHLRCAGLLAESEWGPATSHLVLAIEEVAKAHVLADRAAKGSKSRFTDAHVVEMLQFHPARHPIAQELSKPPAWWVEALIELLTIVSAHSTASPDGRLALMIQTGEANRARTTARRAAELPADWPTRAKSARELGTYASFTATGWSSPTDVTRADYEGLLHPTRVLVGEARTRLSWLDRAQRSVPPIRSVGQPPPGR